MVVPRAPAPCTPGVGTLCNLRIQPGRPSFGVVSAYGVVSCTPPQNSDIPHAPSLDPTDPNLTHLLPDAVSTPLSWVS